MGFDECLLTFDAKVVTLLPTMSNVETRKNQHESKTEWKYDI